MTTRSCRLPTLGLLASAAPNTSRRAVRCRTHRSAPDRPGRRARRTRRSESLVGVGGCGRGRDPQTIAWVVDPASGLPYLFNRYYDPTTGQFISVDPAIDVSGNRYGYVDGEPLSRTDPLGLFWGEGTLKKVGRFIAKHRDDIVTAATIASYALCPETGVACGVAFALSVAQTGFDAHDTLRGCQEHGFASGACIVGGIGVGLDVVSDLSGLAALHGDHFPIETTRGSAALWGALAEGGSWLLNNLITEAFGTVNACPASQGGHAHLT